MTCLHMVLELARSPEPKPTALMLAAEWLFGWVEMTALMCFKVLVSHVARTASWMTADKGAFAGVTTDMLGQLGRFGVAFGAPFDWAVVGWTVEFAARSSNRCSSRGRSKTPARVGRRHDEVYVVVRRCIAYPRV